MSIHFTCPHCGTKSQVADQYAGPSGPCAACGKPVTIPYAGGGSGGAAAGMSVVAILAVVGLVAVCVIGSLVGLLLPAVHAAREAARRTQSANNLKQIGLAVHNHHDVLKRLPTAYITDPTGKPLLSWRVQILPFIEHQDLYNQFHFDEPWDSDHNKQLIARMPKVYAAPGSKGEPGKTNYLAIVSKSSAIAPPDVSEYGKKIPNSIEFGSITDGNSNTVMVVEASDERAVIWTKPDDYAPVDAAPIQGLSGLRRGGFQALFCDGSVKFLSEKMNSKMFLSLFSRDDGATIRLP